MEDARRGLWILFFIVYCLNNGAMSYLGDYKARIKRHHHAMATLLICHLTTLRGPSCNYSYNTVSSIFDHRPWTVHTKYPMLQLNFGGLQVDLGTQSGSISEVGDSEHGRQREVVINARNTNRLNLNIKLGRGYVGQLMMTRLRIESIHCEISSNGESINNCSWSLANALTSSFEPSIDLDQQGSGPSK